MSYQHELKKTNTKLDCVAICSSHWRWKKKSNTFSILCFIISRKVKTQLKCKKKDLCSVWRRCCDWWNMSKWFVKFRAGRFSLDNAPRSGRPVEVDSDQLEKLTENNQRYTPQEITDILKISKSNTENHLHQLGYVNRFDVWVPRKWSRGGGEPWPYFLVWLCLNVTKNVLFLKQIVTVMKSGCCIIMRNGRDRRASEVSHHEPPKGTSLHPKKVILCTEWNWEGVL